MEKAVPKIEKSIKEYSGRAYLAAYRLTGNEADAWDLLQETFVRVLKKAGLYNPKLDFGAWLYRVMFRVFLNRRRSQKRRFASQQEPVSGETMQTTAQSKAGGAESPEAAAQREETQAKIFKALDALPADQRACLVLVDIEGHSYADVANILGWPVGSVAGRLFRARRLMRETLGEQQEG